MSWFKRDEDQVAYLGLFLPGHFDRFLERVPKGYSRGSDGKITFNAAAIVWELFQISEDQLRAWEAKSSRGLRLLGSTRNDPLSGRTVIESPKSVDDVVGGMARHLVNHEGFPLERVKKLSYYAFANQECGVYLIVVGKLFDSPAGAVEIRVR